MKKILLMLFVINLIIITTTQAFAAQGFAQPEDLFKTELESDPFDPFQIELEDEPFAFQINVDCFLSEPVITREDGNVVYRTTLSVKDMSEFYGYQLQVSATADDAVTFENKIGGVTTPTVYKNDKANFATIAVDGLSGDFEVCDIIYRYPYADNNRERILVIDKLDVVTSIAAERTITLGPDPSALLLSLPFVAPPFYTTAGFYIVAIAIALGAFATVILIIHRKRNRLICHHLAV